MSMLEGDLQLLSIIRFYCGFPFFPVMEIVLKSNMDVSIFGISNRFIDNPGNKGESSKGVVVCDMGNGTAFAWKI